jgi:hypothetical protein
MPQNHDHLHKCQLPKAQPKCQVQATPTQLTCRTKFLTTDGCRQHYGSVQSQDEFPEGASVLFCDPDSGALRSAPLVLPPPMLTCDQLEPVAAIPCNAELLFCGQSGVVTAPLGQASALPCNAELLFCNGSSGLASAPLGQASVLPCAAQVLFCDGSSLATAPIGDTSAALPDGASVLFCNNNGISRGTLSATAAVPPLVNSIPCDAQMYFRDGATAYRAPITQLTATNCGDAQVMLSLGATACVLGYIAKDKLGALLSSSVPTLPPNPLMPQGLLFNGASGCGSLAVESTAQGNASVYTVARRGIYLISGRLQFGIPANDGEPIFLYVYADGIELYGAGVGNAAQTTSAINFTQIFVLTPAEKVYLVATNFTGSTIALQRGDFVIVEL